MRKILKTSDVVALKDLVSAHHYDLLHADRHTCVHMGSGEYLLAFHYCDIRSASQKESKVYIFCSADDLIFVTDSKQCTQIAGGLRQDTDNYRQLLEFFVGLCADDLRELERFEDKITKLEDALLTKKTRMDNAPAKIIELRRELLKIKRYYEQLSLITSELAENDGDILSRELQTRFCSLDRRIDRLLDSVLHLRDYATQVREAFQAQIDIEQNQIMKIFTIISAVFLPLTLIVGWYGMNFKIPEYGWSFGYLYVIVISIVVIFGCLALFRRKKWF